MTTYTFQTKPKKKLTFGDLNGDTFFVSVEMPCRVFVKIFDNTEEALGVFTLDKFKKGVVVSFCSVTAKFDLETPVKVVTLKSLEIEVNDD